MMMATASARGKDFRDGALTETGQSEIGSRFWQVWLEQEDKLYRCCLRLMNFNPTEAEDALGQARIKAWEKVQESGDSIRNLTAWLMQLTSNLCKDILEKGDLGPVAVENIELVGETGVLCTVSSLASPQMVLESEERDVVIRREVASLSPGMRDTFILHYYEGLEYREIAERLGLTYDSVCKRISRARQELKKKLRGYFRDGEELENGLEPVGSNSRRKKAQGSKQKIGSDGKSSKKTATVWAAKDCEPVVVEEKSSLKDGAVEQKQKDIVGWAAPTVISRCGQQQPTGFDRTPVTVSAAGGESTSVGEKRDVVSGAVAQTRTLKGPATLTKPACAGFFTCIIDGPGSRLQVSAPLGEKIKEVCAKGLVRSSTPVASDEKLPIQLGEELPTETVAVSAAQKSTSVGEKRKVVSGAVAQTRTLKGPATLTKPACAGFFTCIIDGPGSRLQVSAPLGEKIKEVCAKGLVRSRTPTLVASSEKLPIPLGEELPTETVPLLEAFGRGAWGDPTTGRAHKRSTGACATPVW